MVVSFAALFSSLKRLQAYCFAFLALTLALRAVLDLDSKCRLVLFPLLFCTSVAFLAYLFTRPRPVLLLDYSCYRPDVDRQCSFEVCEYFVRRSRRFTATSEEFMRAIYLKSGLGNETYAPPFLFQIDYEAKLQSAFQEAEEGMISAVDALLDKTGVPASAIDLVIVTCGMFAPSPSLASTIVHHYGLPETVTTYNLSGMGCSSGALAIDLAAKILNGSRKVRYTLVVVTESISLNWYFGDDRSMLVTNCIFRVGTAAVLVTNDPSRRGAARMELIHSLRTHHGADDASYRAAYQAEDEEGNAGIALKKDLIRVAGEALRAHIWIFAPKVLPWAQLVQYAYQAIAARLAGKNGEEKAKVPDFSTAFEHICLHPGGKAVIERVERLMKLGKEVTEPARMSLHRFGNTSSSMVFYQLAYFDAKGRIKSGDRVWMLAFGTGFKVCSLVWRALKDSAAAAAMDVHNPWNDCAHRYPVLRTTLQ